MMTGRAPGQPTSSRGEPWPWSGGRQALGGEGKSLRVATPRRTTWGRPSRIVFPIGVGAEPEEIYFRYLPEIRPGLETCHLRRQAAPASAGPMAGRAGEAARVNGRDGWSARGLFVSKTGGESTAIGFYCYHADQRRPSMAMTWCSSPDWSTGRWYCVEQHCKLNTPGRQGEPGAHDGRLAGLDRWCAGLREDQHPLSGTWRRIRIEDIWVNVYHGGANPGPRGGHPPVSRRHGDRSQAHRAEGPTRSETLTRPRPDP